LECNIQIDLRGASEAILIVSRLELPVIAAISPTLAEAMRSCSLRAALSRTPGSGKYVLGNPKGWLGSAYHNVLEKIADAYPTDATVDATVEQFWNDAIGAQHKRILTHALDRRFGSPPSWPGYHLAKASAALRAKTLVMTDASGLPDENTRARRDVERRDEHREQEFTACGGKLIGRPDVVRPNEIVDFKSGSIVESRDEQGTEVIKAAYVRQLQIYGYLVHQTIGRWVPRGVLLPAVGPGVEIALRQQDCEREAAEAVQTLDAYNGRMTDGDPVTDFATPSVENCKWCPYKPICPSFWTSASPAWSGKLDGAAIEGRVKELPRPIHGGSARALVVDSQAGTEAKGQIKIFPVNPLVHEVVDTLNVGDVVRVIGLRVRPDNIFVPQMRTVITRLDELPDIAASRVRGQQ
jgi:hypothetical protein